MFLEEHSYNLWRGDYVGLKCSSRNIRRSVGRALSFFSLTCNLPSPLGLFLRAGCGGPRCLASPGLIKKKNAFQKFIFGVVRSPFPSFCTKRLLEEDMRRALSCCGKTENVPRGTFRLPVRGIKPSFWLV